MNFRLKNDNEIKYATEMFLKSDINLASEKMRNIKPSNPIYAELEDHRNKCRAEQKRRKTKWIR